jgi:GT2 family glycosyltransferase
MTMVTPTPAERPVEVSIIFVNWNSVAYLLECIASIYENTKGIRFELIVVDNASPQGGVEAIKEKYPEATIIKSERNLGFAGANNLGFVQARGEFVLFLNPDTKLVGPTLNILLEQIRTLPNPGIVGCKMLNTDLSVQITTIQKFPTILNQIFNIEALQLRWPGCPLWDKSALFNDPDNPIKVPIIPGACMLLRRSAFEQVGMFSEEYFMYGEDLDLNFKLKRAGYTNYYVSSAVIIHHGGKSSSLQKVNQWSTIMKYRAMTRYFQKTHGAFYQLGYRAAMGSVALLRIMILGVIYPFGNILGDKRVIRNTLEKWKVVLKWAVGRQDLALEE